MGTIIKSTDLNIKLYGQQNTEIDKDHEKFKITLQKSLPVSNKLYSYGKRKCNIIHSRLRMGCSELNAHLYDYHVIENPKCACGDD